MKQTSQAGVQPRRSLLAALWWSLAGLVASSKLSAAATDEDEKKKKMADHPASKTCRAGSPREAELATIIGRLCLDPKFRDELFQSHQVDANALTTVLGREMKVTRTDVIENLNKILKAKKGSTPPDNPVQTACASVNNLLASISVSCPDWPC